MCDKVRYNDEMQAREKERVYPCPECHGWHITTNVKGKGRSGVVTPDNPWPYEDKK